MAQIAEIGALYHHALFFGQAGNGGGQLIAFLLQAQNIKLVGFFFRAPIQVFGFGPAVTAQHIYTPVPGDRVNPCRNRSARGVKLCRLFPDSDHDILRAFFRQCVICA